MGAKWCCIYNTDLTVLGSTDFQVMENGETLNLLSPTPPNSYETYLAPPAEEKIPEIISKSPLFEPLESPQKRRLSPDNTDLDTSYKRRRNSSIIGLDTPRMKFKEILKTPLDLFSRRKSISSTVTCSLNDSTASTVTNADLFNQSCSSLNFVSTPVRAKVKNEDKFDVFKSPANLFATPKHKSLFKKGFRKSFILDTKNSLKNIVESDPNCSLDDVDVSVCESVRYGQARQGECSFISMASAMEVEEPAHQNFRLTSSSTVPVLTFHFFI